MTKNIVTISCKLKCIDSTRFTASSLSNFVEGIHRNKCNSVFF